MKAMSAPTAPSSRTTARTLAPPVDEMVDAAELVAVAVGWFDSHARDLPWRDPECSPWGVLVSEVMLQQTPVARVEPVWREWLARWPSAATFAASGADEVLRA